MELLVKGQEVAIHFQKFIVLFQYLVDPIIAYAKTRATQTCDSDPTRVVYTTSTSRINSIYTFHHNLSFMRVEVSVLLKRNKSSTSTPELRANAESPRNNRLTLSLANVLCLIHPTAANRFVCCTRLYKLNWLGSCSPLRIEKALTTGGFMFLCAARLPFFWFFFPDTISLIYIVINAPLSPAVRRRHLGNHSVRPSESILTLLRDLQEAAADTHC